MAMQGIISKGLRGSPVRGLLILILTLGGAYEAAGFILAGDMIGLAYVGLGFIVCAFVISMLNSWRRGLYIFLVWLLFEDLSRKFLGNNMAIYFAKDFLVGVVYLSFFLAWRRGQILGFKPPFLVPLLFLVWFGFVQVFNPASPHIIYGALGMKLFFYYMPLMLVGYALVNSESALRTFFKINLIAILVIAALGITQSIVGPSFLTPSNLQDDIRDVSVLYRMAPISGTSVFRPTSVFITTGRYSDLLDVAWLIALGFLGYTLLRYRKGRALAFLSVPVIAVAMLLTIFPEALLGRLAVYSETLSPNSSASELTHRARDYPLQNFLGAFNYERWPYGYGIGTTALGTQYVARIFGVKPPAGGVESGFGVLIVEMGIGGLLLWLVMAIAVIVSAWKIVRKLRGSPWFPVGFVIFWYAFLMLFPLMAGGIQAYEDFVLNAYLWLLLGILFRLPHIKLSTELE